MDEGSLQLAHSEFVLVYLTICNPKMLLVCFLENTLPRYEEVRSFKVLGVIFGTESVIFGKC